LIAEAAGKQWEEIRGPIQQQPAQPEAPAAPEPVADVPPVALKVEDAKIPASEAYVDREIPRPEIPRKLGQKFFEGMMQDIDGYGPLDANDPYRKESYKVMRDALEAKGVTHVDAYHVTDTDPDILRREGIRGTALDYIGRSSGNLRDSSVYMFLDPDDIKIGYDGIMGARRPMNTVVHLRIPLSKIEDLRWDSNFNVSFGTYSSVRLVGDVAPEMIAGYGIYNAQTTKIDGYTPAVAPEAEPPAAEVPPVAPSVIEDVAAEPPAAKGEAQGQPDFEEMVSDALRWQGAAMKADVAHGNDKSARLRHSRSTTKADLDKYLIRKYGISDTDARSVTNEITKRNAKPDNTAEISDYRGEPWADDALAKLEAQGSNATPVVEQNPGVNLRSGEIATTSSGRQTTTFPR
jgi:hypothetical protein